MEEYKLPEIEVRAVSALHFQKPQSKQRYPKPNIKNIK